MSGFKFRFAFGGGNSQERQSVISNGTSAFVFEFESSFDGDEPRSYISSSPNKMLPTNRNSQKMTTNSYKIAWYKRKRSKYNEQICLPIDKDIMLEFINGDDHIYLRWENGAVTRLRKNHIETIVLVGAFYGKIGLIQCTIYENVLDYGTGSATFRNYIDETHPINKDLEEIASLLAEAGMEVISN